MQQAAANIHQDGNDVIKKEKNNNKIKGTVYVHLYTGHVLPLVFNQKGD